MSFKIPTGVAEQGLTGRGNFEWSDGTYFGTIEKVYVREVNRSDEGGPKFVMRDGENSAEVSSIQIGNISPAEEGLSDPGKQKFFDETIVISVDGLSFNGDLDENVNGRLRYAQFHLGNLAHALHLTEVVDDSVIVAENFEELYRTTNTEDGVEDGLAGQRVMFRLETSTFKKRDGSEGKKTELKSFYAAP